MMARTRQKRDTDEPWTVFSLRAPVSLYEAVRELSRERHSSINHEILEAAEAHLRRARALRRKEGALDQTLDRLVREMEEMPTPSSTA
jgi:uncharacterized protein YicC (UPF0701 family)